MLWAAVGSLHAPTQPWMGGGLMHLQRSGTAGSSHTGSTERVSCAKGNGELEAPSGAAASQQREGGVSLTIGCTLLPTAPQRPYAARHRCVILAFDVAV